MCDSADLVIATLACPLLPFESANSHAGDRGPHRAGPFPGISAVHVRQCRFGHRAPGVPPSSDSFSLARIALPAFGPSLLFGLGEGAIYPVLALSARDL